MDPLTATADAIPTDVTHDIAARRHRRAERARRERLRRRRRTVFAGIGLVLLSVLVAVAWSWIARPRVVLRRVAISEAEQVLLAQTPAVVGPITAWIAAERKRLAQPPPLTPAPGVRTIVVVKASQLVTAYEADGSFVDQFQCATGHTYPRVGTYKVTSRKPVSWYPADGSRFEHFVVFTKADTGTNIGFHSIPTKKGVPVGGLGQPVSHGCVRLANDKAEFLYGWATNGTKVIVQK